MGERSGVIGENLVKGERGFKELQVWQRAKELAVLVYRATETGGIAKDSGRKNQMRRAAVSIPSNIAEGDEQDTNKDSVRLFFIAKGSLAELRTQSEIALEIGYLDGKMLQNLTRHVCHSGKCSDPSSKPVPPYTHDQ